MASDEGASGAGLAELVVITGPIGSGKSSVARALAERLNEEGCAVAVLDLDDVVWSLSAPLEQFEISWQRGRRVHGDLVGSWLRSGIDVVVAHGPFFTSEEVDALLAAVPEERAARWALLLAPFDVALDRVQRDPDREISKDEAFLRRTHDRFHELRDQIPTCEWTLDTTRLSAAESAAVIADALAR